MFGQQVPNEAQIKLSKVLLADFCRRSRSCHLAMFGSVLWEASTGNLPASLYEQFEPTSGKETGSPDGPGLAKPTYLKRISSVRTTSRIAASI